VTTCSRCCGSWYAGVEPVYRSCGIPPLTHTVMLAIQDTELVRSWTVRGCESFHTSTSDPGYSNSYAADEPGGHGHSHSSLNGTGLGDMHLDENLLRVRIAQAHTDSKHRKKKPAVSSRPGTATGTGRSRPVTASSYTTTTTTSSSRGVAHNRSVSSVSSKRQTAAAADQSLTMRFDSFAKMLRSSDSNVSIGSRGRSRTPAKGLGANKDSKTGKHSHSQSMTSDSSSAPSKVHTCTLHVVLLRLQKLLTG